MMILARANRHPRATPTPATRAVQRFHNRIISVRHVSPARRKKIYDSVVSSCRHRDLRNDRGPQLRCRKTHIAVTRAFDILTAVPEHVRLVARARAASSESAITPIAFLNDGVVE
jgi:hypothetical protein